MHVPPCGRTVQAAAERARLQWQVCGSWPVTGAKNANLRRVCLHFVGSVQLTEAGCWCRVDKIVMRRMEAVLQTVLFLRMPWQRLCCTGVQWGLYASGHKCAAVCSGMARCRPVGQVCVLLKAGTSSQGCVVTGDTFCSVALGCVYHSVAFQHLPSFCGCGPLAQRNHDLREVGSVLVRAQTPNLFACPGVLPRQLVRARLEKRCEVMQGCWYGGSAAGFRYGVAVRCIMRMHASTRYAELKGAAQQNPMPCPAARRDLCLGGNVCAA